MSAPSSDHHSADLGEIHDPAAPPYDRELSRRVISYSIVALTIMSLLGFLVGKVSYDVFIPALEANDPEPLPIAAANERRLPPTPRLQEFPPTDDIEAFHEWEDRRLESYAVLSEEEETFQIPVERAIELLVERGLPVSGDLEDATREIFGEGQDTVDVPQQVNVPAGAEGNGGGN
ncbi:MAG: hypothetical protein AAGD01_04445 [Acidobacteriota bacterium]